MTGNIERYRDNLRDELNGAALYAALAAAEADPLRKDLFLQLSQAEEHHARLWREKLAAAGVHDESFVPALRTRLLARLARHFGPRFVLPTIAAAEFADRNKYAAHSDAQEISAEERGRNPGRGRAGRHARHTLDAPASTTGAVLDVNGASYLRT